MATVTATKKRSHSGSISTAGDVHVVTLTGEDTAVSSSSTAPPYVGSGGGTSSRSVRWFRLHNTSSSSIRYTIGSSTSAPAAPASDGSTDGSYLLEAGAVDTWDASELKDRGIDTNDVQVKLTTAGTSVSYTVEAG